VPDPNTEHKTETETETVTKTTATKTTQATDATQKMFLMRQIKQAPNN